MASAMRLRAFAATALTCGPQKHTPDGEPASKPTSSIFPGDGERGEAVPFCCASALRGSCWLRHERL